MRARRKELRRESGWGARDLRAAAGGEVSDGGLAGVSQLDAFAEFSWISLGGGGKYAQSDSLIPNVLVAELMASSKLAEVAVGRRVSSGLDSVSTHLEVFRSRTMTGGRSPGPMAINRRPSTSARFRSSPK